MGFRNSRLLSYTIRPVDEQVWPNVSVDIQRILNMEIIGSPFIYREKAFNDAEIEQWFLSRMQHHGLTLSCLHKDSEQLVGFATYGPFRSFSGSVDTVEHSIYVDQTQRGCGVGTLLLHEITLAALEAGRKSMVGVIDAENKVSLHLHDQAGFMRIGCMKCLGSKWGVYRDAWFVQRMLS